MDWNPKNSAEVLSVAFFLFEAFTSSGLGCFRVSYPVDGRFVRIEGTVSSSISASNKPLPRGRPSYQGPESAFFFPPPCRLLLGARVVFLLGLPKVVLFC